MTQRQWTGDALTNGVAVNSGNVNTAGNGDTVSLAQTGTYTVTKVTKGLSVSGAAGSIWRFDQTITGRDTYVRMRYKHGVGVIAPVNLRIGSSTISALSTTLTDYLILTAGSSGTVHTSPAPLVAGDEYDIHVLWAQNAGTRTTSNGRAVILVEAVTDPTWNTSGDWYADSGYTVDLGTADFSLLRLVKPSSNEVTTACELTHLLWEDGTGFAIDSTHDTRAEVETNYIVPVAIANTAPLADAGPDQADIDSWQTVTLDGTGSSDSDGTIAAYSWTQTAGTTVTLSDATAAQPTFEAPGLTAAETLTFQLEVTDDDGATDTDTVNVGVLAATEFYLDSGGTWQPLRIVAL